jgi:hypothetical protein
MTKLRTARNQRAGAAPGDRYKWVALANTTASMFMATLDGSIVIIALPAIRPNGLRTPAARSADRIS